MLVFVRRIILLATVIATVGLSACLPEDKDPTANSDVGKLTGAFYAAGLGNVAVQIQNAIVGNSTWFTSLTGSMELDLAAMGISANGLGAPIKSHICPTGNGTEVQQITWIDNRDANGRFTVKGVGTDAGTIIGSLRGRVAGDQVGMYSAGNSIAMSSGANLEIPATCAGVMIPTGAPVIAFKISRPAPPTSEMTRTEYRTTACGNDAGGRARRGTMVQSRTINYKPDGTISPTAWSTESMGQCVDDVVVQLSDRTYQAGGRSADLNNFAAVALRGLLQQQLQMDCTKRSVTMTKEGRAGTKMVDTCGLQAQGQGTKIVAESDQADGTDVKILQCSGSTALILKPFINLYGPGTSTTTWESGTATIVRKLDNTNVDLQGQEARRDEWIGTDINCRGYERFYSTCANIPGNPTPEPRHQNNKWITSGLNGYETHNTWLNHVFGVCWFGSCEQVTGGSILYLNREYFTGIDQTRSAGTTTTRPKAANSWINPKTFQPYVESTDAWTIYNNQCEWSQRVLIANCPFTYDPGQQGSWNPGSVNAWNSRPPTLDPGVGNNGTTAGQVYQDMQNNGFLTAQVVVNWESCDLKGCDYWSEYAGPGTGAYIKAWTNNPLPAGTITLSSAAMTQRTEMCNKIAFQLDASSAVGTALANAQAANTARTNAQTALTAAITALNAAQAALTQATNDYNTNSTTAQLAQADANNKQATLAAKQNIYNDMDYRLHSAQPPTATQQQYDDALADRNAAQAAYDAAAAAATAANNTVGTSQDAVDAAQTAVNTAQADKNAKQTAYNTADANATTAQQAAVAAQAQASTMGRDLTQAERDSLTAIQTGMCSNGATAISTLDATQQSMTRTSCTNYYNSPATFAFLQSYGLYCDAVFDRRGPSNADCNTPAPSEATPQPLPPSCPGYTLAFRIAPQASGTNVVTTLLNTEGVRLAWRPQVENNNVLITRQRGFIEPLYCARSEYSYFSWPVLVHYWVCAGKGGCYQSSYYTSTTITKMVAREWSGLSYETGTWSNSVTGYSSPYGSWNTINQIPNPISTW